MKADPAADRRTLAIAVNARNRCGLDPMLVGNIFTTLNVDLRRGEAASSVAERIRHNVDHFAEEHCDMRINQEFLDAAVHGGARCVSTAFNPAQWTPIVSNQSGFGVYRIHFEDTFTSYCTLLSEITRCGTRCPGGRGRCASKINTKRTRRFGTNAEPPPKHAKRTDLRIHREELTPSTPPTRIAPPLTCDSLRRCRWGPKAGPSRTARQYTDPSVAAKAVQHERSCLAAPLPTGIPLAADTTRWLPSSLKAKLAHRIWCRSVTVVLPRLHGPTSVAPLR